MGVDLTIIVPIYNVDKYVDEAIESLVKQRKFSFEVVLVDDGSTDFSGKVCDKYCKEYPEIVRVVHKKNGGLPSARKTGVELASGRYIGFLDGDDWCGKEYYFNMMQVALQEDADVVCSGFTYVYDDKFESRSSSFVDGTYEGRELQELKTKLLYMEPYYTFGIYPSLCTKIVRADLLKKYIYTVPNGVTLGEDAACSYPMLFEAQKVVIYNQNVGYYYRQVASSMSHAYNPQKVQKIILVMDYLEEVFKPFYDQYGDQISYYFGWLIKEGIGNEINSGKSLWEKRQKLEGLLNRPYTQRTLEKMKKVPLQYRIYFGLFEKKNFLLLSAMMKIKKYVDRLGELHDKYRNM